MQSVRLMPTVWCVLLLFVLGAVGPLAVAAGEGGLVVMPLAMGSLGEKPEAVQEEPKVAEPTMMIRLGATHFDPLFKQPAPAAGAPTIQAFAEGATGYYVVQFDGPVVNEWKLALTAAGAEIFDYVPDFAFMVRMNADREEAVRALAHVRWVGIYQPSFRISQDAMGLMYTKSNADEAAPVALRVNIFPGVNMADVESRIQALGGQIKETSSTKIKTTVIVEIPAKSISVLTGIDGVKWIEPTPQWKLHNNVSTDVMNVRAARDTNGLYGSGQTVCVADTGLDEGFVSPANLHDDFEDGSGASRVTALLDTANDSDTSDTHGHGTHVAGSVLGNGDLSGSDPATDSFPATSITGMAPKASLVFQALMRNSDGALLTPADLNFLFGAAQSAGADLHTNSWGSAVYGRYTSTSQDVDEFMWNNKNFLIQFSAGNDGIDMDADGVIDQYSLGAPATAKNCLTVGASEGDRPTGAGLDRTWISAFGTAYSAAPISTDHVSDNDRGMAAFSSRGPTLDGRHKPDIVAPGTNILSTRSSEGDSDLSWGTYSANSNYIWMGGTSMSNPLAAGAAALMREYLMTEKSFSPPSAALIKAALLNSAEDIEPGQYGLGADQEIPDSPVPNNVEGWGRLNLGDGVFPTGSADILYFDESPGVSTGGYTDYLVQVSDAGAPLKINLVWTDYPATPAAQGGLVNDLDLVVTAPDASISYADHASQKSTVTELRVDDGTTDALILGGSIYANRLTPASYPVYVDSVNVLVDNRVPGSNLDVVVYDDNGGVPGTALFTKRLPYLPSGAFVTIPVEGVEITSGDFYVGLVVSDSTNQLIFSDAADSGGRCYFYDNVSWVTTDAYTWYLRANVRSADASTSFDRVNNTLGVTINTPQVGVYSVRVAGYNVAQGPQPYALVASGNIQEATSGALQFENTTYSVSEDGTTATIGVIRTGSSSGAVSIQYASSNGTATAGSDYTAASGTLNWLDGDSTAKTFTVPITNDTTGEADETVNLTLSNPAGALLGPQSTAVLTIEDDEAGVIQFSAAAYSTGENSVTATLALERTNGSNGTISVNCTTSDGTATAGSDYTAVSQTVSIADGVTSGTLNIAIIDDTDQESAETLTVTLSSPTGGATIGPLGTVTLTINANDTPGGGGGGGCFIDTAFTAW